MKRQFERCGFETVDLVELKLALVLTKEEGRRHVHRSHTVLNTSL
jgi:hypothetical protein